MKVAIKRCPKCISEELNKYYPSVGKMTRAYTRDGLKWIPMGWYCEEHDYFISDKSENITVLDNVDISTQDLYEKKIDQFDPGDL